MQFKHTILDPATQMSNDVHLHNEMQSQRSPVRLLKEPIARSFTD